MRTILLAETLFSPTARAVLGRAGTVVPFESYERFLERLPDADAVVAGLEIQFDAEVLGRSERLAVIASRTSQLRHIDLDTAARRGIEILFIDPRDPVLQRTASTAEETFALVLALARNLPWAFDAVKRAEWDRARYGGRELHGKTLGLIGFGRLGRMVAGYARAFGMEVLAFDPNVDDETIAAAGAQPAGLELVLADSDVVSVHCTYSAETYGLLGAAEFATMRRGAFLVNTARGEITDQDALLAALLSGHLGGAAVDTLAGELPDGSHLETNPLVEYARGHENLIVLPHLGGATAEATERTQLHIAEMLVTYLERT
jgi:D-3-phosphoglycerate dehydrogenase / 2-oxoglutarate reductase